MLLAAGDEGLHAGLDVLGRVRSGELQRMRAAPFGTTGKLNAVTKTPCSSILLATLDCLHCVAEQDRDYRVLAIEQVEAFLGHAGAEVCGVREELLAQLAQTLISSNRD